MSEVPLIRLSGITKHYGNGDTRVDALKGIDFEIHGGSVAALVGKSGSGKSTLLNVVGCILAPSTGHMEIDGEVIADGGWLRRDYRHLRLHKIGFIFQFHNLIPFLNCVQNVELVMKLAGTTRKEARRRSLELLDYLGVAHRANRLPATLSGGEAQRVAIARALANRPRIVLADEPTASLDAARTMAVVDLLRRLAAEQNAAILIVSHDEQVAARCDHVYQMSNGTIEGGSADDMYYGKFRRLRHRPADPAAAAP
jgi:putative ABC transport system ATP-binding protein